MPRPLSLLALLGVAVYAKNTLDYLEDKNIKGEQHRLVTEDGYVLHMFRIPNRGSTPVLMMHGFMATTDQWLLMEREYNIANVLADNGYDVWMLNQRGNVYSHEHMYLSTEPYSFDYWNFSCEELAVKDLPSSIDYILKATRREKLLYAGHSMGTTIFFILCSKLPHYCSKIDAAVLLAPVVHQPRSVTVPTVSAFVEWSHYVAESLRRIRIYEFLGQKQFIVDYTFQSCLYEGFLCTLTMQALDFKTENKSLVYPIADYFRASLGGTSVKVYEHISNMLKKDGYFGPLKTLSNGFTNVLAKPPEVEEYKFDIDVPVSLFWALDDIFVDESAISRLRPKLKNLVFEQKISPPFKHMGFFYDLRNNYAVVRNILNVFSKYDSSKKRFHSFL